MVLVDPTGLAVYVVNTFFPNPDAEHGINPKIDQSVAKNLAAAGVTYLRYGEYSPEMLADIVGNPSNDVVFLGHSVLGGQDFLIDPIMLGRNEGQLTNSGLGGLVAARSFSVIGCSTTELCGSGGKGTPGARIGGVAAGDSQDPGTNRLAVFTDRLASYIAAGIPLEGAIKAAARAANTDSRIKAGQAPVVVMKVCADGSTAAAAASCGGK